MKNRKIKLAFFVLAVALLAFSVYKLSSISTSKVENEVELVTNEFREQEASRPLREAPVEEEIIEDEPAVESPVETKDIEIIQVAESPVLITSITGAPLENDYNVGWVTFRNESNKSFDLKKLTIQVTTEGLKLNPGARFRLREDDHIFLQEMEYGDRTFSGDVFRELPAMSERTYKIEVMNPVITSPDAKIVVKFIDFTIEAFNGIRTTIESGATTEWSTK